MELFGGERLAQGRLSVHLVILAYLLFVRNIVGNLVDVALIFTILLLRIIPFKSMRPLCPKLIPLSLQKSCSSILTVIILVVVLRLLYILAHFFLCTVRSGVRHRWTSSVLIIQIENQFALGKVTVLVNDDIAPVFEGCG